MNLESREQLAVVCNQRKLVRAVEVGTDRGVFAASFLSLFHGQMLFCVDPYEPYEHMPFDRTADLLMAVSVLARFSDRCKILKTTSALAAGYLRRWRPTFVYIDGDHKYEQVRDDIRIWWDVLPEGGLLAGHDFDNGHDGVMRAVMEFAREVNRKIVTTSDDPPSWVIER